MDCHSWKRSEDGVIKIHVDGTSFRNIEEIWATFKEEPYNARISLIVDGVNPFREIKPSYSVAYFCYTQ